MLMTDSYSAHLAFARGLVNRFADRVIGLDVSLDRIVNARPPDQVLGGFLTASTLPAADEDGPTDDLREDSDYEQTSLGLEWLAPYKHLVDAEANVSLKLSVYVRVFPEYEEQLRFGGWRQD